MSVIQPPCPSCPVWCFHSLYWSAPLWMWCRSKPDFQQYCKNTHTSVLLDLLCWHWARMSDLIKTQRLLCYYVIVISLSEAWTCCSTLIVGTLVTFPNMTQQADIDSCSRLTHSQQCVCVYNLCVSNWLNLICLTFVNKDNLQPLGYNVHQGAVRKSKPSPGSNSAQPSLIRCWWWQQSSTVATGKCWSLTFLSEIVGPA